ncbi:MAG: dephospho-CoA kinase [Clostridiales bacterium]|jgi:dephospho-CoA kinase|nr:dephospho-CoA kinase [Clostridiales bacterium]
MEKPIIVGLTGNSGSGKTSVAAILEKRGVPVIDCDKIAKEIMQKGSSCYYEVINFFGGGILGRTKDIDRAALGDIVFNDKDKLSKLNYITHRYIISEICLKLEEILSRQGPYRYIVIDAPVLIGTGLQGLVDRVWVVYTRHDTLVKRLLARDGRAHQQILSRLKSQPDIEALKPYADVLIENSGGLEELERKINDLLDIPIE